MSSILLNIDTVVTKRLVSSAVQVLEMMQLKTRVLWGKLVAAAAPSVPNDF